MHTEGQCHVIEIPSSATEVHSVQSAVHAAMARCGFDDDACFAVKLAVEESVINAMRHGNKFDLTRRVRICFEVTCDQVRISVKDEGGGFDPNQVPDPTAEENLAKPSGRGIMLMKAYMDEVHYTDGGTEVIMVKRKK